MTYFVMSVLSAWNNFSSGHLSNLVASCPIAFYLFKQQLWSTKITHLININCKKKRNFSFCSSAEILILYSLSFASCTSLAILETESSLKSHCTLEKCQSVKGTKHRPSRCTGPLDFVCLFLLHLSVILPLLQRCRSGPELVQLSKLIAWSSNP